ncbi:VanZ family protein [Halocatena marina]|uniref:VanZ family protein n=1 Tax=Halocatena marina TaxID=2934937 RepID=UPI003610B17F
MDSGNNHCCYSIRWVNGAIPFRYRKFGRFGPDKFLHFVGHAGLSTTLVKALEAKCSRRTAPVLAVGSSTIHGVITNSLQQWIPGRKPEYADVVAGFLGSVAGVWFWQYILARPHPRQTG